MRYGKKRSVRAYRIEGVKYPEWQFQIPLTKVLGIIVELSRVLGVSVPRLKFRSMRRTHGNYRAFTKCITISSFHNTIACSTVIHEFGHHLNSVRNNRTGHDEYFLDSLDKVYAVAKESYSKLAESNKEFAYAHQAEQESIVARRAQRVEESRSKFSVGQRVSFKGRYGGAVEGKIYNVNRKTITVKECNDGSRGWRVGLNNSEINILENA